MSEPSELHVTMRRARESGAGLTAAPVPEQNTTRPHTSMWNQ